MLFPSETGNFERSAKNTNTLYRVFAAYFISQKINNYLLYNHVGIRQVWNYQSNEIWCSPCKYLYKNSLARSPTHFVDTAYRCLISLLPASLTSMTFEVSGAIQSSTNERSQTAHATMLRRLCDPKILLCLAYCGYASIPFLCRLCIYLTSYEPSRSTFFFVFPGVILKLLDCIFKSWVPVWYMMFPPTTSNRNELLVNMAKKGKENCGGPGDLGGLWVLELLSCLVIWCGLH